MRGYAKPIHFVITKWDLLRDYTLPVIRDKLLSSADTGFRELVDSRSFSRGLGRKPVGTIRLIPVSSLGDFAVLGPNWTVKKSNQRKPTQVNVEVPLVAAITDVCDLALRGLRQEADEKRGSNDKRRSANSSFLKRAEQL